jgi:hypothetical protein
LLKGSKHTQQRVLILGLLRQVLHQFLLFALVAAEAEVQIKAALYLIKTIIL